MRASSAVRIFHGIFGYCAIFAAKMAPGKKSKKHKKHSKKGLHRDESSREAFPTPSEGIEEGEYFNIACANCHYCRVTEHVRSCLRGFWRHS